MLLDDFNIKVKLREEVAIDVAETEFDLVVEPSSDFVTLAPPKEVKLTIEKSDLKLNVESESPDYDLIIEANPDVIVLPTNGLIGPPGPAGATGSQGPAGPQGPQGATGPAGGQITYIHDQLIANTTWVITHNLNSYPSVTVVDTGGSEIIPDVTYVSANELVLHFAAVTSGKAYLN